jgi:hypothetical protein
MSGTGGGVIPTAIRPGVIYISVPECRLQSYIKSLGNLIEA